MAITHLISTFAEANGSAAQVTIPSTGVPAGSVAVAVWTAGLQTAVLTDPVGWTRVSPAVATNSQVTTVLVKTLTVDDPGSTVVFDSTATGKNTVVMSFFGGVDPDDPIIDVPGIIGYGSTAGTVVTPSSATRVSPVHAYSDFAIEFAAGKGTDPGAWTPPVGFSALGSAPGSASGALTVMIAASTTDLDGGNTWALAGSWPQGSVGGLNLRAGGEPGPTPVGSVAHLWVGAPTHNSAQVSAKVSATTSVQLAVSTSPSMDSPTYTPASAPDAYGYIRFGVTGLDPNTRYWFRLADTPAGGDRTLIGDTGSLRTLQTPGVPFNGTRKVLIGGCLQTNATETAGLDSARGWGADWGHFNGDFFYNGGTDQNVAAWVDRYNNQIQNVGTALRNFIAGGHAAYELVSDHDSTNVDNGDSNTPGASQELAGWRVAVPHLPDSGDSTTRDQQWQDGRVAFFMIDCRSVNRSSGSMADGPTKTMLGAAQKARLLNWLSTNTAPFKVIISDAPWMGPADIVAKPDAWWSYANERQQIIDAIDAQSAHVEVWHGDSHLIGYATPEKNTWGGFPVLCAAPYYQDGGGRNLSTFSQHFNNNSEMAAEYGRVTFADDGETITRTFVGWDALTESAQFTFTTTVDATPEPGDPIPARQGLLDVEDMRLGSAPVSRLYHGTNLLWQRG